MPFPENTTDLTFWMNASEDIYTSVSPDVAATDDDTVRRVVGQSSSSVQMNETVEAEKLTFKASAISGEPALEGGGTHNLSSSGTMADIINADEFHVMAVIRIDTSTLDSGSLWNNHNIVCDGGAYWSLLVRDDSGSPKIYGYLYDTGAKSVSLPITVGDVLVVSWRCTGGNMYLSLNGGSESSVACGNIGALTANFQLAARGSAYGIDGLIAEVLVWDVSLSTVDRDANITTLKTKYGVTTSSGSSQRQYQQPIIQGTF